MKTIKSLLIFCCLMVWAGAVGQPAEAVVKVSLTVSCLNDAVKFYTETLDFQHTGEQVISGEAARRLFGLDEPSPSVRIASLKIGGERLELMEFSGVSPGRPIPPDSRSNDAWFQHIAIVVSDMGKAYQCLRDNKVAHVSTAPQTLPDYLPAAAGISAFYFRDPDGHNLELIHFPKGKGSAKWHLADGGLDKVDGMPSTPPSYQPIKPSTLFLGIDHTAIGIEDTDRAYAFWRDALQLKIGGHSENYGTEQEHLNQVFGARLYITGMVAGQGFGVEFLDYIAPPGGRLYPADSRPNDLWHWHTTLRVKNLERLLDTLLAEGFELVSKGIVALDDKTSALMVRDPDGHAVLLLE